MSRTPLSIESLVEKQRAEQQAASKPKFLTREERAKLAIERRAAEIRGEREKEQRARDDRDRFERDAQTLTRPNDVEMRDARHDRDKDRGDKYGGRCA
ncbi:hypothetical protein BN14_00077 [Rhizoctonia solani AG-1 IB]|uniref:Uncharacterized protein n=1 Tax=Thanatephorus cucumeris (strain AG1-IB / isolate 7/3/14) TaxID=1108050 RepID=M5BI35_THACB|nr:hypothetical protein BN14_00077 [Rhizoctonia solani AG-1 IB]